MSFQFSENTSSKSEIVVVKSTNFLGVPVKISAMKKGWTRIDQRLCQDVAESAWPHTWSNRPRVRPKGGCHKTLHVMCLETEDPNSQKQGNVCESYSWTNRSLNLKLKLATGSALLRRERSQGTRSGGALYIICADFIFGLSRSRFRSPTTVTACLSRNSLSTSQRCSRVNEDGF